MNISKHENKIIDATELLMDNDMEKILLGTYEKSKCAPELSEMYGIPTVTCYKKIKMLKKRGLLRVTESVRGSNGRNIEYYTANLENAYVFYDSGRIKVRFTVVLQMADDFRKRFQRATGISRGHNDDMGDNQT
jgi:predicted ArsR family transcriptional regulator